MKKISLFALTLGTSMAMFAQSQPRLVTPMSNTARFGIKAGASLGDLKFKLPHFLFGRYIRPLFD